jgi:hypothetical protein
MFMPKTGISVTLSDENLLWLKSRTQTAKARSLSHTLDALVTDARLSGRVPDTAVRSVVGTIDIAADDPNLDSADAVVRDVFAASIRRPLVARETRPPYGRGTRGRRRG